MLACHSGRMSKPLAFSYIRMSTELQLKGDSLRRQTELSERYAEENDLELVRDFNLQDIGVSAFKGANIERGALGRFLEAVERGAVPRGSYLLVESLDRLSRQNLNISLKLFLGITQSGVNLVTLADNHLYQEGQTDLQQLIYSIVVMARANEESETKSKRIAAAWKNKRDCIDRHVMTKTCPAWMRVNDNRTGFDVTPNRADVVQRIFQAAANGQGSGLITRLLNQDGVPAFGRSDGWLESYVTKILKNRAVLGEFQPHQRVDGKRVPAGNVIPNYYPKIIEENLFLKVQAGRRERTIVGAGRRGPKQRNLFTHIAKCDYCGSPMRFINKGEGPKGGKYLKCSASVRGMDCVTIAWKYGDFEKSVFSFVREFDLKAIIEDSHQRSELSLIKESMAVQQEKLALQLTERQRVFSFEVQSEAARAFVQENLDRISDDIVSTENEILRLEHELEMTSNRILPAAEAEQQLLALTRFTENADFRDRLLVSGKLKELIREIRVASDGAKPKLNKIKSFVREQDDGADYLDELLATLHSSHFDGPRSHPYFTVFFHNGTSRVVIPQPDDPTSLILQADHDGQNAVVRDVSRTITTRFGAHFEP